MVAHIVQYNGRFEFGEFAFFFLLVRLFGYIFINSVYIINIIVIYISACIDNFDMFLQYNVWFVPFL